MGPRRKLFPATLAYRHGAAALLPDLQGPNRNGGFLNVAASFAEKLGAGSVVVGFNREEAETFPDNTRD